MSDKSCHDIRKVERYVDPHGREIVVFTPVFGKEKEPPLVKGTVVVRVGLANSKNMSLQPQNIRLEWSFPEGTSIKKAFEVFDESAKAEVEKFKQDQMEKAKENKIIGARAMPPILGANGQRMGCGNEEQ